MDEFKLVSPYKPKGDQPKAIEKLIDGFGRGEKCQTLMGVTGSGKTFTMANVIKALGRPTLVMSHNKTLAAQLYSEFKEFFPHNAVRYFVSYYDYYQPEAYIPQRDIYIEKEATVNQELDRLRLAATSALMTRRDVVIVASVSCIYGLGSPEEYQEMYVPINRGDEIDRNALLRKLVNIQYERNDLAFERGVFRVRGDVVEIFPSYEEYAYRIEFFGDEIDRLTVIDPLSGEVLSQEDSFEIYPAKHFVMPEGKIEGVVASIEKELVWWLDELRSKGKHLEAQRLEARTRYDMEMIKETGYCHGIENYSRHVSGRAPGEPPYTLIDYFPKDFFMIVDESHVTVPQIGGMYNGDRSRKETLVNYGFRLPSALDNRPLRFGEWEGKVNQVLYVSATPSPYELEACGGEVVEQIIRPTGLLDPVIHVRPAATQVKDLLEQIKKRAERGERVLATTLTKRLAEDLSEYMQEEGLKGMYLHSELDAFERVEVLRDLRMGRFDVVVGVNLLREGLDLPEVSLVAILDADKEGFLRSETSLIQTVGRTARNVNAEVILYADTVTSSMKRAIDETARRRQLQLEYNQRHHITPQTIRKEIRKGIEEEVSSRRYARQVVAETEEAYVTLDYINELKQEMQEAAAKLDFERAAELRDKLAALSSK
ncbi:MAG: excinuclease ABC subunit B [Planctomycetes bacterium GWA2_50_13]|nr:MAG: excinuclease ABC subunit B [Planctomycetes bacterium GWA2_50_13]OHB95196.1 MAG: excinuclease ABC subunit B [Planctomycetes bacterium RIFCSPLOWO2_02_FULL_50_16]OHC04921.1 MAG: excinuclease ABC subunit B [Planctomycetes bacterium RIFCSPLOWO2_12_FULL_50_35]